VIIEYIRYRIDAPRTEAFLGAYREAEASLRASPHCLGYDLSCCTDAPDHFVLRIHWDSAEGHLAGFRTGPHFPGFFRAVQPFVADIEEMRHYDATGISWSREGA
jgi:quinol monooxygenase YgiN